MKWYTPRLELFYTSTVSSSVCYVTMHSPKGFYWFIICLLRHCCVLGFDCLLLCFVTLEYYLFKASVVSLSVCYVSALSRLRLSLLLFVTSLVIQAISVAPLQTNYDSEALQTQYRCVGVWREAPQATASERLAQGTYVAAKTRLKPTTFHTKCVESINEPLCPLWYLFKVSIVLLSVYYVTALF